MTSAQHKPRSSMAVAAVSSPGQPALAPAAAPAAGRGVGMAEAVPRLALIPAPSPEPARGPAACSSHRAHFPSLGLTGVKSAAPKCVGSGKNQLHAHGLLKIERGAQGVQTGPAAGAHPCMGTPESGCSGGKMGLCCSCGD